MEDYRTQSLETIKARIVRDRNILGIKTFNWNETDPIEKLQVPSIYMFEGRDEIEKYSQKNPLGYPARRHLEINIEIVLKADRHANNVKEFMKLVKRTVLCDRVGEGKDAVWTPNPIVANNSFIKELRMKGPGTYEVPELAGMKLVLGLWYTDNGLF